MKELTDEQYLDIWRRSLEARELCDDANVRRVKTGRAAYAASFPHAVAEACEEPNEDECDALEGKWGAPKPDFSYSIKLFMRDRLARLTAKPDAAVEAVKVELKRIVFGSNPPPQADEYAAQIVAAVDAARAKEPRS